MKISNKVIIKPFAFPIDNIYYYDAQIWTSLDGGETFYHCGNGKQCKTIDEANEYKKTVEEQNSQPEAYTTQNGLKLLKDWSDGNHSAKAYEEHTRTARRAAALLFPRLTFAHGEKPRTSAQFFDCLPYTSSGAFAAVWSGCNFEAVKRGERLTLKGIAITTDGAPVAFWKEYDENGDELGDVFEVIR